VNLSQGQRIGPYEILAPLGAGGMGDVYRAHDPRLGRDVALKVLPAEVADDPERLERFRREARAVAALNHPHIVTIFSIEEEHGVPFMTMELVEGRTLDHTLTDGALSLARFFDIGVALADALSAAHRKGIVHRDLKPANVMVTDDGVVKVLDFGLARETKAHDASGEDATSLGLTQAGIIVGTVPYMSPEQIEAKPVDHRSDIFSLGVVLYEMATGMRPFSGASSLALMSAILKDRPRPLTELRADVPEGVWRLAARCLEKVPSDRVQSGQDVHAELKALRRSLESGASAPAMRPAPTSGRTVASDLRVAVLPFTFRGSSDAEALADGVTDDITAGLSRFQYLRVVSRRDAETAKGHSADALAAERVGARYLVEGTVRTAGTAIRLNVRLVDTTTSAHMWAENYDRSLGSDAFALQDDLAARVVATVGDTNGVLARSLSASLKDRNMDELTVSELVMRFYGYGQHFRPEEHRRLRAAFERALVSEPSHAQGWACLAILYEQEHSQFLNPLPESHRRSREAADRSVEIDPICQAGWRALAALNFLERDFNGFRVAAERVVALNPLNTTTISYMGMLVAYAGEWARGVELVEHAIDLNPHHPGWVHYVLATNHYRKREFDKALVRAKRSNLTQFVWTPLCVAVAAGQLGHAADARAALDGIRKNHPAYLDPDKVRELWSTWLWDADLVEQLLEGFVKALALVDRPADAERPSSAVSTSKSPPSDRIASIAVMPFADLSPAKDQEWFCDGIAEEILNALTPLKNLRVAARASAFSLRGKSDDLTTIGEKLNVTTVLGGSVRRAGDRVRITVQLSEVQSGSQLWSERYDRELDDIFDIQDEIAKGVADRLKVTLVDGPLDRLARLVEQGTTDIGAYQLYLQGRALLNRRGQSIPPALEAFNRAVELDPNYSLAWAGIADAHTVQAYFGAAPPSESKPLALEAARRALELDPSSAAAHTALACATLLFENNRELAGTEFERALQLNPQYVQGRSWYALFYWQWARGDFERGVAEARRTLESDPLSAYATMILTACLFTAGRPDEAIEVGRLAVERDPESFIARWMLGNAQIEAGRYEEAIATLEGAAPMSRRHPFAVTAMAAAFGRCGKPDAAETLLRELTERAEHSYVPATQLIAPAEAVGRRDLAIQYAERAWAEREPSFILLARYFPEWRSIRSDSRFQAILREMDAPVEDP
jgi:TolB-like protein/cytochrome c-type biogenesis protein CcmH/NrfG